MNPTRLRLTLLALALSATTAVTAQTNTPPSAADLERSGAVTIAPPIVRNQGTTVVTPDRPMLGQPARGEPTESGALNVQPPPVPNQEAQRNEASTSSTGTSATTR